MSARVSANLGNSSISFSTGKLARQADGSVVVQQGETIVLVTACAATRVREGIDFFPLMCDYRERTYAAGKFPGGFFKREGRPTEKEILSSRLMDRPIRPLFQDGMKNEVQIMAAVISSDGANDPDVLAMVGASCALRLSSIPFEWALGAVRVGLVEGQWVANPTYAQLAESPIDLVVAGTSEGITMLEGGFQEVSEAKLKEAAAFGYEHVKTLITLQEELVKTAGKSKSDAFTIQSVDKALLARVQEVIGEELKKINTAASGKGNRYQAEAQLKAAAVEKLAVEGEVSAGDVSAAFELLVHDETRKAILEQKRRMDGRSFTDIRNITCEVGILPRTHGSALFTRGETQSLAVTTLGTRSDEQMIESLEETIYKRFMLHYNFPPFSVGEVRPLRGTGRREIGHGALAERSLEPMIPSKDEFPYTVRVVSDILESNGSSSMASVCAGSMALMDAGVPIKAAVAGVAMGLITDESQEVILTDIAGLEDHIGDMDFKLAGTRKGATALQVDVKLQRGLSIDLVNRIIDQATPARAIMLDKMDAAIAQAKPEMSAYAPRITRIKINPDKIRDVIGPGGKMIRSITAETGASIDIEDDGSISIASSDAEKSSRALEIIRNITDDVEVGKIYNAKVKRIMNFGAFCEILPGKEGLVRVSELDNKYVSKVEDVIKVGDSIRVKVIEIDEQGRVNLSKKRVDSDGKSPSPKSRDGERASAR